MSLVNLPHNELAPLAQQGRVPSYRLRQSELLLKRAPSLLFLLCFCHCESPRNALRPLEFDSIRALCIPLKISFCSLLPFFAVYGVIRALLKSNLFFLQRCLFHPSTVSTHGNLRILLLPCPSHHSFLDQTRVTERPLFSSQF